MCALFNFNLRPTDHLCYRQGLVLAYPVEILPYNIRAKGLTVTFFGVSTSSTWDDIQLYYH